MFLTHLFGLLSHRVTERPHFYCKWGDSASDGQKITFLRLGFEHTSFTFAQEANMHENRFNEYRIPSGMLVVFLEKALTLIHMETHLDDVSDTF